MDQESQDWRELFAQRLSRRIVLRGGLLGGAGLAAAALIGCGDDDDDGAAATGTAADGDGAEATSTPRAEPTSAVSDGQEELEDWVGLAEADGAPVPYGYAEPPGDPKPGGVVTVGVIWSNIVSFDTSQFPSAYDALNTGGAVANRVVGQRTGPRMSKFRVDIEPELASSWEIAPDGMTYTFRLEPGVKFQNLAPVNGRLLTAQDVKLALDRFAQASGTGLLLDSVDQVATPDDGTVEIALRRPEVDFLNTLGTKPLVIYAPELYEGDQLQSNAIGTGPAILDEYEQSAFLRVKANPDYWQGKPLLDGIEWRPMRDPEARKAAFRVGQIESGVSVTGPAELDALLSQVPDAQVMTNPIIYSIYATVYNPTRTKFQDERTRQAMVLAIDDERAAEIMSQGWAKTLPMFGWPFLFDKPPSGAELGPWYRYDPAEAKKLLAAAGAEDLEWEAVYWPGSQEARVAVIKDMLRDVGVELTPKLVDSAAWQEQFYGRKWLESTDAIFTFVSRQSPSATGFFYENVHSQSVKNYFGINDPEIDDWADKQRIELNPEDRKDLLRKIWDKALASAYSLDTPTGYRIHIYQPWLRYYRFNGPYNSVEEFHDFGRGFHKAWLDK